MTTKMPVAYIIEDQAEVALLYSDALTLVGYAVKIFRHGYEAINHFEVMTDVPTLIVLDVNLPGAAGDTVLAHIRQRKHVQHVPIMVVTANSVMMRKIQPQLTERDCIFLKPLAMTSLQAFAQAVRRSDARDLPLGDDDHAAASL